MATKLNGVVITSPEIRKASNAVIRAIVPFEKEKMLDAQMVAQRGFDLLMKRTFFVSHLLSQICSR